MSAPLTPQQEFTVVMAARLGARHGDVISEFEGELVKSVARRYLMHGPAAAVTPAEWPVLEAAAQAMAVAAGVTATLNLRVTA